MTLSSRIAARLLKLPPPRRVAVSVERNLETKMADGTVLLADRWFPLDDGARTPVIVLRSPYGRWPFGMVGRLLAERGYITLIQSCRGTFGSGGDFVPFRHEQADGKATLDWVAAQPWFGGVSATFGASYLGIAQWAVAAKPPDHLRAFALDVTSSTVREIVYPGGTWALETGAAWLDLVEHQELPPLAFVRSMFTQRRRMAPVFRELPLERGDEVGLGRRLEFFRDWLAHSRREDPWWDEVDFSREFLAVPPTTMVGGWYDLFLPGQVRDFQALRRAGREVRLTIGPWVHTSVRLFAASLRDGLEWFDQHLLDRRPPKPRRPVRLFVMGSRRWAELDEWPPPATIERWHLHPTGRLAPEPPRPSSPDRFRYDPADPTPSTGGASLNVATAGPKDQKPRESRLDVLTYTSDPVDRDVTVAGPLSAEMWLRSSCAYTDLFVRLCDVDERGRSVNLSDGILRIEPDEVTPAGDGDEGAGPAQGGLAGGPASANQGVVREADGSLRVPVALWPTAVTFRRGHRIRLQVSSGAHPLYARNLGSGEPLGTATTLCAADQEVFHDPEHPSAIALPISPI